MEKLRNQFIFIILLDLKKNEICGMKNERIKDEMGEIL